MNGTQPKAMKKLKAIIIDDMPLAIASLKEDLKDIQEVDLIGTAEGVISGAKIVSKLKPDLIFLDVHMGDGDGFDLLEIIADAESKVIFTTASKDHAIQAFRFEAVDYLLKPIDPELLQVAVSKTYNLILEEPSLSKSKIVLNTQEEIRMVDIDQIIRLESMGNYTTFFTADGNKILVTKTMKEYEKQLDDRFLRVHQSHLVNLDHIKAYIKSEGGYLKMKDGSEIPVSVRKKTQVIEKLKSE